MSKADAQELLTQQLTRLNELSSELHQLSEQIQTTQYWLSDEPDQTGAREEGPLF